MKLLTVSKCVQMFLKVRPGRLRESERERERKREREREREIHAYILRSDVAQNNYCSPHL